jgi:uncharacterized ParB-like nuclease family protein
MNEMKIMTDSIETINPVKGTITMKENEHKENSTDVMQQIEMTTIELGKIQIMDTLRCRKSENEKTIREYSETFKEYQMAIDRGELPTYPFPSIKVWYHNGRYYLLGGFHRVTAARWAGLDTIQAEVFYGSEDEAFEIALADNKHGLKLSSGDKKYSIRKALLRFPDKSLRAIAKEIGCSVSHVSVINKELHAIGDLKPVEKRCGLDRKEHTVKPKSKNKQPNVNKTVGVEQIDDSPIVSIAKLTNALIETYEAQDTIYGDRVLGVCDLFTRISNSLPLEERGEFLQDIGKWLKIEGKKYRVVLKEQRKGGQCQ